MQGKLSTFAVLDARNKKHVAWNVLLSFLDKRVFLMIMVPGTNDGATVRLMGNLFVAFGLLNLRFLFNFFCLQKLKKFLIQTL